MSLEREGEQFPAAVVSRSEVPSPGAPAPQESYTAPDAGPGHPSPSELSERGRAGRTHGSHGLSARSESSEAPYPEAPLASRKAEPEFSSAGICQRCEEWAEKRYGGMGRYPVVCIECWVADDC